MSFVYSHPFTGIANGLNTINAAGGGAVGGWVELGRTTAGGAVGSLEVSSLADKRYYMVLANIIDSGGLATEAYRLGNSSVDTGSNYSFRRSVNGAADATGTSISRYGSTTNDSPQNFSVGYLANLSGKEKLNITHAIEQNTAGAANAPNRMELTGKWTNTSNPLDLVHYFELDGGTPWDSGSELVVLGWDSGDSHTNNFWEELASVDLSGGAADNLSSGTITAKKYLWVQYYVQASGSAGANFQFNNDTGSNYAVRHQDNGTTDSTATSQSDIEMRVSYGDSFGNMFIINNSANEKLVIAHEVDNPTAGAGTAPQRTERVGKWANTSNQITEIDLNNDGGGDFDTGTIMKVWGAD